MQKKTKGQKLSATNVDKEIGLLVKYKREHKQTFTNGAWKQEDVAKLINVSSHQYQKYEGGKDRISISTLIKLANLLEFTDEDKLAIFKITE